MMLHRTRQGWSVIGLAGLAACIEPRGYTCVDDTQCDLNGQVGRCEPTGSCSYPDDTCPSKQRYEPWAANGLMDQCVDCPGAQAIYSGWVHSCAVVTDGQLYCWGGNNAGQLGRNSTADSFAQPAPVQLPVGAELRAYQATEHACALVAEGDAQTSLYCWGKNQFGQADWTRSSGEVAVPVRIDGLDIEPEVIGVGYGMTCAAQGGKLHCWGQLSENGGPVPVEGMMGQVVQLAIGDRHGCVLMDNSTIYCFGEDDLGQLGDGPEQNMSGFAFVELPEHNAVKSIAADRTHTCAILNTSQGDEVVCWGGNHAGQAGALPFIKDVLPAPEAVDTLERGTYQRLAVSELHGCVLNDVGRLWCWGDNQFGRFDPNVTMELPGTYEITPDLDQTEPIVDIATCWQHTCILTNTGRIQCWGCNILSQLGPGPITCAETSGIVVEPPIPCEGT